MGVKRIQLLLADDDTHYWQKYTDLIEAKYPGKFKILTRYKPSEALSAIAIEDLQIVITDMNFQPTNDDYPSDRSLDKAGLDIVETAKEHQIYVVFLSSYATGKDGAEATHFGADDVLNRPHLEDFSDFLESIERAYEKVTGHSVNGGICWNNLSKKREDRIVGSSECMSLLYKWVNLCSNSSFPVTIHGEVGTEKALVAEAIHFRGLRASQPFIRVDCGKYSESSEFARTHLFADDAKTNILVAANHGTLFLNDVHKLPQDIQEDINASLDDRGLSIAVFENPRRVTEVRLIVAVPVTDTVVVGKDDDRFELIELPPLHERIEDIALLTEHFIKEFNISKQIPVLEPAAIALFQSYRWPRNVDELRQRILHGIHLIEFNRLTADVAKRLLVRDYTLSFSASTLEARLKKLLEPENSDSVLRVDTGLDDVAFSRSPATKDNYLNFEINPRRWTINAASTTITDLKNQAIVSEILGASDKFRSLSDCVRGDRINYTITGTYYLRQYCTPLPAESISWIEALVFLQFWKMVKQDGKVQAVISKTGVFHYFCDRDGDELASGTVGGRRREMRKELIKHKAEILTLGADAEQLFSELVSSGSKSR
jgi:DNA-binding NtrC family response regulator